MERVYCLGDSFTSGDNVRREHSFPTLINNNDGWLAWNHGVGGTTFGDYSIYPVQSGISTLFQLSSTDILLSADVVLVEFGINDASALSVKYTDIRTVTIEITKYFDLLHQLISKRCKVYLLSFSSSDTILRQYAQRHHDYLKNDYFKHCWNTVKFESNEWADNYSKVLQIAANYTDDVISMISDAEFVSDFQFDVDNIHPDKAGYQMIANNILQAITQ